MTVQLTILGCGSSGGVPRIGNDWGACDANNPRNRRLRCAALIEKVVDKKRTTILVDTSFGQAFGDSSVTVTNNAGALISENGGSHPVCDGGSCHRG